MKAAAARWENRQDPACEMTKYFASRRRLLKKLIAYENVQAALKPHEAEQRKANAANYAIRLDEIDKMLWKP